MKSAAVSYDESQLNLPVEPATETISEDSESVDVEGTTSKAEQTDSRAIKHAVAWKNDFIANR
jgi:hypothetical protein